MGGYAKGGTQRRLLPDSEHMLNKPAHAIWLLRSLTRPYRRPRRVPGLPATGQRADQNCASSSPGIGGSIRTHPWFSSRSEPPRGSALIVTLDTWSARSLAALIRA